MPNPHPSHPRREPTQLRSRRLVARVLAAAARVFAGSGYGAATTNRIAEQAGVSVGSLYQFFPNKAALLLALRRTWLERVHEALGPVLAPTPWRPLPEILEGVIGAFERLDEAEPGLLRVLMTHHPEESRGDKAPEHAGVVQAITGQVERLIAARAPQLDPARRAVVAALCVHLTDALFQTPGPGGSNFDPAVVREVKAALKAYLEPLFDEPAAV